MADSWSASKENMKHIKSKGKQFVLALKSNRLIALNQKDPQRGEFKKLSELELGENTAVGAYIKGVSFLLLIAVQIRTEKFTSGIRFPYQ